MPPSNAMENDKKRLRNQFTKDERTRLLAIMTEYGPLLDDKNISILSRKEIWEIIENKFNENGHSGRTSAQLKKYWQNYKYHSKRTKIIHKEVPKPLSPMTKHMVRMLAKVNPEDWAQYDVAVSANSIKKSPGSSRPSPTFMCANPNVSQGEDPSAMSKGPATSPQRSSKSSSVDATSSAGGSSEICESNVVISTTDVPGSSVTVSVICPEVSSKARTIFWKRNMPQEKFGSILQSGFLNETAAERDFSSDFESSDICKQKKTEDPLIKPQSEKLVRKNNQRSRFNVPGISPVNKSGGSAIDRSDCSNKKTEKDHQLSTVEDRLVRSHVVPGQKVPNNQSPINIKTAGTGRMNQSELIGNVIGVVKEVPTAKARLYRDCDSMERLESISMTNGRNETTKISAGSRRSILNPFSSGQTISREDRVAEDTGDEKKGDPDYSELGELLGGFSAIKESLKSAEILDDLKEIIGTFNKFGNEKNFEGMSADSKEGSDEKREYDMIRYAMNRGKDYSPQDFLSFKLYLRLLRGFGESGGKRRLEILRKFAPLISRTESMDKTNEEDEESCDSDPAESERGMEVDEDTNPVKGNGKLRVRRVSLMPPAVSADHIQREIKVETEIESEATEIGQNPINENIEDSRSMNSMNHLVQAKLQLAKSELDHQLKLQKLEIEEKELRVRIAEMTIQETRLRIQALVEERLRATELHELRLAQISAEKVRSEAEHAARIDASCISTAEGRARINSIERDRERSENFYQMQLRCMNATSSNGNKVKQYQ